MNDAAAPIRTLSGHGILFLQFSHLASAPGLRHGISLRKGTKQKDFNLSRTHPDRQQLLECFCSAIGVQAQGLVLTSQVHGNHVEAVDGVPSAIPQADALCTAVPGLSLLLLGADCPLILLYDPRLRVVGVAHAGWRSTVTLIVMELVKVMTEKYGCRPCNLQAGIGPCICPRCFEVGHEVIEAALAAFPAHKNCILSGLTDIQGQKHWHFDMAQANCRQLIETGLQPENIVTSGSCTYEDDRFWSYRRDGKNAGRWGLLVGLV